MDILDDMGVSKLSAKVFFKVNYLIQEINNFLNTGKTNSFVNQFHGVLVNMLVYYGLALLCIQPKFPFSF